MEESKNSQKMILNQKYEKKLLKTNIKLVK